MRHMHCDLIIAWANGVEIQYEAKEGLWVTTPTPNWAPNVTYRATPISIKVDWGSISPHWKFITKDSCGSIFLHEGKPEFISGSWRSSLQSLCITRMIRIDSYDRVSAEDSLIYRH